MSGSTRGTDFIGRFGGDEFSILLPETSHEGAELVARRILEKIRDHALTYSGGTIQIQVSIGIAVLVPPASPPEQLAPDFWAKLALNVQNEADLGLYEAKNAGKGRASPARSVSWPVSNAVTSA